MTAFASLVTLYMTVGGTRYLTDVDTQLLTSAQQSFVTQLTRPISITSTLPDRVEGAIATQQIRISLSNTLRTATTPTVSYLFTLNDLYGVRVHAEIYDLDAAAIVLSLDGVVVDVPTINDDEAELVVESVDTDGLDTPLPQKLIREVFPSADLSTIRDAAAPVRVPFGIMRKVDIAPCVNTFLSLSFTIAASGDADKFYYLEDTGVPNYLIQAGDRLVYDIYWTTTNGQIAMGLFMTDASLLHSTAAADQNGISNHPNTNLDTYALNKWYRRDIALTLVEGKTIERYAIACEHNTAGTYGAYLANAAIVDRYGNVRVSIFNENIVGSYVDIAGWRVPLASTATISDINWWLWGALRKPTYTSYGLSFVGTGKINIADKDDYNAVTVTYECKFKVAAAGTNRALIVRAFSTANHGIGLYLDSSNKLAVKIGNSGGASQGGAGSTTVADDTWRHGAVVINDTAKTWALYVNGVADGNGTYTGTFTTGGGTFSFGEGTLGLTALTGSLDDVRIWGIAMAADEVIRHYLGTLTGFEENLLGYWNLDENTGTTAADRSPFKNTGTITAGTWVTGASLIATQINTVYLDGGVMPRGQWAPHDTFGYSLVRFDVAAPRSIGGQLPHIQVDLVSWEFDRNPATLIKFLLTDANGFGINKTANAASFTTGASDYDALFTGGYKLDGGLSVQSPLRDILSKALLHGAVLQKNSSNDFTIAVDKGSPATAALHLGDGDFATFGYMNCRLDSEHLTPLAERIATLRLHGAEDPGFTGQPSFLLDVSRTIAGDRGKVITEENPFVEDWATLDHEVWYQLYRRYHARRTIQVRAHRSAKSLVVGQLAVLHAPNRPNLDGNSYEIGALKVEGEEVGVNLIGWNSQPFDFVAGSSQGPPLALALTDYSQTAPDAPTSFTFLHTSYTTAGDGTVTVNATAQATSPATGNISALVFVLYDSAGTAILRTLNRPCTTSTVKSVVFEGLATNTTYKCEVYALAVSNRPGYQEGVHATALTLAMGNAPGTLAAPTGASATAKPGKKIRVAWSFTLPLPSNFAHFGVSRRTTSGTHDSSTIVMTTRNLDWHDGSLAYGDQRFYAITAINTNGQLSAFTAEVSERATRHATDDSADDSITSPKRQIINSQNFSPSPGGVTHSHTETGTTTSANQSGTSTSITTIIHSLGRKPLATAFSDTTIYPATYKAYGDNAFDVTLVNFGSSTGAAINATVVFW